MRLIDADALKEKAVDADYMPTGKWLSLIDLETASTVDPVDIVRCRDCKYKPIKNTRGRGWYALFPEEGKCPCQCDDPWYSWVPDDDWYCADGRRKE